uniref:Hsp90 co-chaperone Cdc37 n=1 Tax=Myripristis murdjan TaxID=586833 RepID=A0A667W8A6_9TELE
MTSTGIDYSVWDHIYVSDDEDVTHPNVDTPSLYRMRHRARLEQMAEFQQRGEDLENNLAECKRRIEEAQGRVRELEEGSKEGDEEEEEDRKAELIKARAEVKKLRKDKQLFEKMMEEYRREEKRLPWNVDTLSKDGFSKSVLNIKPVAKEETEEEKEDKHKTFVEKYEKQIKHFGMMRRWDDSQKCLSDNPHLVCEETANYLVGMCIDLEVEEVSALCVAHQTIVMQFILELARTLQVDPRGCFRQFFSKIKTADKPYQDAFNQELDSLKERVCSCAQVRIQSVMKELEEEERQKRLGPGGLDPVEVYNSLPKVIHTHKHTHTFRLTFCSVGILAVKAHAHLQFLVDALEEMSK